MPSPYGFLDYRGAQQGSVPPAQVGAELMQGMQDPDDAAGGPPEDEQDELREAILAALMARQPGGPV